MIAALASMISMDTWPLYDDERKKALLKLRHWYKATLDWAKIYEDDNHSLRTRNLLEDIERVARDIGEEDSGWQWYDDWDDEMNAIWATMKRMGVIE